MKMTEDKAFRQAAACLPPSLGARVLQLAGQDTIEELRLRVGRPPAVRTVTGERALSMEAADSGLLRDILSRAARYSLHSYAESLRHGFVTLAGGHRLGVCGTAVVEGGHVGGIRAISSLNLRVARQQVYAGQHLHLTEEDGRLVSTLLLSPPGIGKTTLLREMIRRASDAGHTVAVADERCEIAALADGTPQFDIGARTDVIEGCCKREATEMLLKTMSPELLALDEITAPADVEATALCAHCGVAVLATAHARDVDDLRRRALYRELLALRLFERVITISLENGQRIYKMERIGEETVC